MVVKRWHLARRRVVVGMSRERLAERLGVEISTVTRWEDGDSTPRPFMRPGLAELLDVSLEQLDDLLSGLPITREPAQLGGSEADTSPRMMVVNRPQAGQPWEIPEPTSTTVDPEDLERTILMDAERSSQYRDQPGNIGEATIEHLQTKLKRLSRDFNAMPTLERYGASRLLRDRLFAYLEGGQRITRRRELNFLTGAACGMLAEATQNLGYAEAAMTHTSTGLLCADEAGSDELRAWLLGLRSMHCAWAGQPGRARELARHGRELATVGAVSAFLPAMEARTCGALADAEGVDVALQAAAEARENLAPGALDEFEGFVTFGQGWRDFAAAKARLDLGDGRAAVPEATAAVAEFESQPAEERDFGLIGLAYAAAATGHMLNGDFDAGRADVQSVFDIPAEHRSDTHNDMIKELYRYLRRPDIRDSRTAIELRDQIEDFLTVTPTRPSIE